MSRRYADYLPTDGFTELNIVSSIGAFILGISVLPFTCKVFKSWRYDEPVTVDDPWGYGNSLEWTTSCPPPRQNFTELPGSVGAARVRAATCTWWNGCAPRPTLGVNTTPRKPRR
jgi:heme/copper-type cytochrome/quinol oxidase subunit 1